ncbi:MAG: 3-methyl-2-oxobutanoate hydroxymethyltransferase [Phycisphaerales bacterium]|nr:3-methyl-2-oxobutanoate hydroxymethyltransferase [Phycisphaerales bacterium]
MPHDASPVGSVTLKSIRRMVREGRAFACLTCYDATTARWLARAGVHVLLVGDSAAEVVLGFPSTVHMPLEVSIALTAAVKRGAPGCLVMADMPFMSYQADEASALRNAGRFMTEGLADIVKIEADKGFAPLVEKMTRAGIPVCAHIGYRPQSVGLTGGPVTAGKGEAGEAVLADARALEEAGAVMLLAEAVPAELAARLVDRARVPVIGIAAGPACHGQILVLQDLLGLTENPPPFVRPEAELGPAIRAAAEAWVARVEARGVHDHRSPSREELRR